MKDPREIFQTFNSSGGRALCPADAPAECERPDKADMCVQVNSESAFCHRCKHIWWFGAENKHSVNNFELTNTREPLFERTNHALEESDYLKWRDLFIKHYPELLKILKLPWNDTALDDVYGVAVRKDDKGAGQLMFKIDETHVKLHKGPQFGANIKCKLYPRVVPQCHGKPLLVVEGEKDAVSANCANAPAITFTSGAGALPSDLSILEDEQDLVIVYDNDEVGRDGAKKVAAALYNKKRKVRILNWVDKPDKYDLTDFFCDGYSSDDLYRLVDAAPVFGREPEDFGGSAVFSPMDFMAKFNNPPEDICDQMLFEKGTAGIAAATNVGKSIFALQFAASVAMGVPFLGHFRVPRPRKVLYMQYEMLDDVIGERLALQTKPLMEQYPVEAHFLNENLRVSVNGQKDLFSDSYDMVEGNLRHGNYELIVIDNLYSSTNVDTVSNDKLVALLSRITALKNKYNCAVLMVNHHKKQNELAALDPAMVFGGSAYTNWLDNLVQIASTKISAELKVIKITKVRMRSDLHWIPAGMKLHNDDELYFEFLRPLPKNEMFWYTQQKESDMDKVLNAVNGDHFAVEAFATALNDVLNISSTRSLYKWLDKMVSHGMIIKSERGQYQKIKTDLDDFI